MHPTEEKLLTAGEEPKLLPGPEPPRASKPPVRVGRIAVVLLIVLGGLFLFGYWRHRRVEKVAAAQAERERNSIPMVNVAPVHRSPAYSDLLLPGSITPLTEAYLYARATGYVKKRYVDIGDRVHQGQLMAEIEAPDLDQQVAQGRAALAQSEEQLRQARSDLEDSRSQLELAKVTWDRYQVLVSHGAISRQEADQQFATYRSAKANVSSAQANVSAAEQTVSGSRANVERLVALQSFEKLRAPFDGVVTARNFDVGALISGGGGTQSTSATQAPGGGSGSELFRVAQIRTLRILIYVPQENAPTIHVGQPATVFVEEFSKQFHGSVTRTANSVDPTARTLLTEVQVPNPQQVLLPGMYAQVQLSTARSNPPLLVPGDSIITSANGIEVAVLEDIKDGQARPNAKRIHIQKIEVGRDYGPQIEVTRGLQGWEHVVVNPSDVVQEGAVVQPNAAPNAPGEGNPQRRGPTERTPTGLTGASPGASDSGGRGASTKGSGKGK
jgi:RND family efflux transporter MFP subunit